MGQADNPEMDLTTPVTHVHLPAGRVFCALAITLFAAVLEIAAARSGGSLFLAADAVHLVAHTGIFVLLLIPPRGDHAAREDLATIAILILIELIGLGIIIESARALLSQSLDLARPELMLFSLAGLAANLVSAYLFYDPARLRWTFRAALAHELSDASLTLAGLAGALAIHFFGALWIDPLLSLAIGVWLVWWAGGLLARRAREGTQAWARMT